MVPTASQLALRAFLLLPATGLLLAGCGGGDDSGSDAAMPAPVAMTTVDPATAGTITGRVMFDGEVPPADAIQMAADPNCARMHDSAVMTEFVVTDAEGNLQNTFLYIKEGLEDMRFPTPTEPVVLNQEGCIYLPHVFGIQVGQPLNILNSDQTLHNIHATPSANQEFNIGQPVQGMSTTRTFDSVEVMVPFKCDVHRWMNSYVGVLDHPYFAVSGPDGSFTIGNVPPGTYLLGAWHERYGEMDVEVTVPPSGAGEASFTFTPPTEE